MLRMLEMVPFLNKKSRYLMSTLMIFNISYCLPLQGKNDKFRNVTSNNQCLCFLKFLFIDNGGFKGIFVVIILQPVGDVG